MPRVYPVTWLGSAKLPMSACFWSSLQVGLNVWPRVETLTLGAGCRTLQCNHQQVSRPFRLTSCAGTAGQRMPDDDEGVAKVQTFRKIF